MKQTGVLASDVSMSYLESLLEADLLRLGQQERELEQKIVELRLQAKEAVHAGNLDRADEICTVLDRLRSLLGPLQSQIMDVERRLYGLRRRGRR